MLGYTQTSTSQSGGARWVEIEIGLRKADIPCNGMIARGLPSLPLSLRPSLVIGVLSLIPAPAHDRLAPAAKLLSSRTFAASRSRRAVTVESVFGADALPSQSRVLKILPTATAF